MTVRVDIESVWVDDQDMSLLHHLERFDHSMSEIQQHFKSLNILELTFEDDVLTDPKRGYQKICKFLGLPAQNSKVRLSRTTPFPLSEIIENFSEVQECLAGTDYAWMLDDT